MPVTLSTVESRVVRLEKRFGTGYATIVTTGDDGLETEAPVVLGCFLPVGRYRDDIEFYLQQHLSEGAGVRIIGSGAYAGQPGTLPVVEIITPAGETLSETILRKGWAIPDENLLAEHVRTNHMIAAVSQARMARLGVWGDKQWTQTVNDLISPALYERTGGQVIQRDGFILLLMMILAVIGIMLGLRAWYYRYMGSVPVPGAAIDESRTRKWTRRLVAGPWRLFGLQALFNSNDLKAMPSSGDLKQFFDAKATGQKRAGADTEPQVSEQTKHDAKDPA